MYFSKWVSRTFWLAVSWTLLAALGIVINAIAKGDSGWLVTLITSAGVVVGAYVGLEKFKDIRTNKTA